VRAALTTRQEITGTAAQAEPRSAAGRGGEMVSSSLPTRRVHLCSYRRRSTIGAGVLGIGDTLGLLAACVRQFGHEHRPSSELPRWADGIVIAAISGSGLSPAAIRRIEDSTRDGAIYDRSDASTLTLGAHIALKAAASVERGGGTWGESLAAADRIASQYFDLVRPAG